MFIPILKISLLVGCWSLCSSPAWAEGAADQAGGAPPSVHVTISGEVHAPGRYEVPATSSMNDLLSVAGGLTEMGANTVYLSQTDETGRTRNHAVNLKDTRAGAPGKLHEGDSVLVPRAAQFSISGEVNKPGTYRLDSSMTVLQAIQRAGDVTIFGSYGTAVVRRMGDDGKAQTIRVKPDDLVEPDDVIRVKTKISF
jgi:polysaccharide export outer membrane protein